MHTTQTRCSSEALETCTQLLNPRKVSMCATHRSFFTYVDVVISSDSDSDNDVDKGHAVKRARTTTNKAIENSLACEMTMCTDSGTRLTRCENLSTTFNSCAPQLSDFMSHPLLIEAFHFNYMVDVKFLRSTIPIDRLSKVGLTIVAQHITNSTSSHDSDCPTINTVVPRLPFLYGTHHSKIMILFYSDGSLRVVIHTANIIPSDWMRKTQGLWISPPLTIFARDSPPRTTATNALSRYDFKKDLMTYLTSYQDRIVNKLRDRLKLYDFSPCRAILIASVPGRHTGSSIQQWGHMRLRSVINDICPKAKGDTIIAQFSSVGSFTEKWLKDEFFVSLKGSTESQQRSEAFNKLFSISTVKKPSTEKKSVIDENGSSTTTSKQNQPALKIIYPTVNNVRSSSEGWGGGDCLPYSYMNWSKQEAFFRKYMHQWKSDLEGRTSCIPHIKTYTRLYTDGSKRIDWHVITSSNLSKAAWGQLEKNASQLSIRSYELGVMLAPELFPNLIGTNNSDLPLMKIVSIKNCHGSKCTSADKLPTVESTVLVDKMNEENDKEIAVIPLQLPFDVPLIPYASNDEAFTKDKNHLELDIYGHTFAETFPSMDSGRS